MNFILELALVIAAAMLGSAAARMCGLPMIVGYLVGGLFLSPFTWGPSLQDAHQFDAMAEIGILLLMFTIGAEFSPKDLMLISRLALVGAPLAVTLFMGLGVLLGLAIGLPILSGAVLGAILSVASTMVLAQMLESRREITTSHGTITIALSLVEDLVVVVLSVLIPILAHWNPQHATQLAITLAKALLILAPVLLLSFHAIPGFLNWVAQKKDPELLLITTLALCIGAAAITGALGLSLALGAFLAGILISSSEAAKTAVHQLQGTKNLCVAIAFVSVGALIDPQVWWVHRGILALVLLFIVVVKMGVWIVVIRGFGFSTRTSLKSALLLSQIGEFSFILGQIAKDSGILSHELFNIILSGALFSILINCALVQRLPPAPETSPG